MDITIGSYTIKIEIVLLVVILLIVIFGHTMCSCCNMSLQEGFHVITESMTKKSNLGRINLSGAAGGATGFKQMEGFANNNSSFETPFSDNSSPGYYMNPNDWAQQTLIYSKGTTPSAGVQEIWDRSKEQKPAYAGQLSFFDNINFSSECCKDGSNASNSEGCACYTVEDINVLKTRGGNTTMNSEF